MGLPKKFGRYTLVEKIARGGTAEVYRALFNTENGFSKPVAVKKLLPSWCDNDELREMMFDEGRVLVHLQHQAIAQVFELGSVDGTPFIAMEFVDGIDCARLLVDLIRDGSPLPMSHALYIIGQVLLALEFAHRSTDSGGRPLEIVHRDISPSNILLSWNGEVKVVDFGIAKGIHRTRLTSFGHLRGKYSYMAPEQARGENLDVKADIFSCGIVLFELITARRLFDAPSEMEVLKLVREARFPADVMRSLPGPLQAILIPALSSEREYRYSSAADMLKDIRFAANSMGELSTSLEFAEYLNCRYGRDMRDAKACPIRRNSDECRVTEVFKGEAAAGSFPIWRMARIVGVLTALLVLLAFFPLRGQRDAPAIFEKAAAAFGQNFEPMRGRPQTMGVIAIDTEPSGALGVLVLGEERQEIKTPFTLDDIPLGEGLNGGVELALEGYKSVREDFVLTGESSSFVQSFPLRRKKPSRLSVQSRPWGLVDVPGYLSKRESPVRGLEMEPGSYIVTVYHPPSNRVVKAKVSMIEGESKRCVAVFEQKASIGCR